MSLTVGMSVEWIERLPRGCTDLYLEVRHYGETISVGSKLSLIRDDDYPNQGESIERRIENYRLRPMMPGEEFVDESQIDERLRILRWRALRKAVEESSQG